MWTTHIIIGATVAKHGDASTAAKLDDKKGQGTECHGKGEMTSLNSSSLDSITVPPVDTNSSPLNAES
jgi:hypothetical protein